MLDFNFIRPISILELILMLKEVYQIHLYNYVHFQYIQGGMHMLMIQWYLSISIGVAGVISFAFFNIW